MAGIIAAKSVEPSERMPYGIARDAMIVPLEVFQGGDLNEVNEALQWVLERRVEYAEKHHVVISVVNMSLGFGMNFLRFPADVGEVYKEQRELILTLRGYGAAVTASAGSGYFPYKSMEGMDFPAIVPGTVCVGAVFDTAIPAGSLREPSARYKNGATVFSAHAGRIVAFSQRLSERTGAESRTDVFAPGFFVTFMGPVPSEDSRDDPARTLSTQDGASQAGPVTAGVVLLLQERFRTLYGARGLFRDGEGAGPILPSVDLIEKCLRAGGQTFVDGEDAVAQAMDNVTGCAKRSIVWTRSARLFAWTRRSRLS